MRRTFMIAATVAATLAISGCATSPPAEGALIADPYEDLNRDVHEFNKGLDTALLQPAAEVYDFVTPALFKHMLSNQVRHLQLPSIFVNRVLQGEAEAAGVAFGRFGVNTIMGGLGFLDPATEMGLPYDPTDFGVTLAVLGAEEGVYHEAPLFGPSTTRDLFGRVVNFALDPTVLITAGVVEAGTIISAVNTARTPATIVVGRHENAELIDDVFYRSDDSYVTAKTGYVQNRRRQVAGGETDTEALPDIFE